MQTEPEDWVVIDTPPEPEIVAESPHAKFTSIASGEIGVLPVDEVGNGDFPGVGRGNQVIIALLEAHPDVGCHGNGSVCFP
jgi:hypothetical protein